MKHESIIGKKFGRLTVIEHASLQKYNRRVKVKCVCGVEKIVRESSLKSGVTKSCGCAQREIASKTIPKISTTHGMSDTPEYHSWWNMKQRCCNKKVWNYKYYGGRGITVCQRWLDSFENFIADMGKKPSLKHSLDRKDNDQGYFPKNCKWSTPKEQVENRRVKLLENFSLEKLFQEIILRQNNTSEKWDYRFLFLAKFISSWSKDPSTQVGAIITRPDKTVASVGYNGFVKGGDDSNEYYSNRKEKLSRIIHGEINALIHASETVKGYTLYTIPLPPCDRCCVQMLQAGITSFVWQAPSEEHTSRWGEAFEKTKKYIIEAGATYKELELNI